MVGKRIMLDDSKHIIAGVALFLFILIPSCGYNMWKYVEARSLQATIRECSLLDEQTVNDDEPLKNSEYVQRLQVSSLKERANQIRRRYNRGWQKCQAVREHLMELNRHGYVYSDVREQVEEQLKEVETRNEELRKQYNEIVLFAEKYCAEAMTKRISKETERTAQLLDEKNQMLLQSVELPREMQERSSSVERVEQETKSSSRQSIPESDMEQLDAMVDRLRALKCKRADSALYQRRLLALLPLIRNGADVDVTLPETKGNTALHFACALGSWNISQWLVEHGANVNAKTHRGATPMDCLEGDNAARIKKLLQKHGGKYGL